ncbi:MAG TPA: FAD-dependent oxidoreductase, partial [Acetobacteraceae bacterium]|nr:FAD-dependent oxidoreductase [Acetobacteraceae bacterium]
MTDAPRPIDPASTASAHLDVAGRTELLVVGAGSAGIAAALEGRRQGLSVVLVDENPVP